MAQDHQLSNIYRKFVSLLEEHGQLDTTSEIVLSYFINLPPEDRKLIMDKGSIKTFLSQCPEFVVNGNTLALKARSVTNGWGAKKPGNDIMSNNFGFSSMSLGQDPGPIGGGLPSLFNLNGDYNPWSSSTTPNGFSSFPSAPPSQPATNGFSQSYNPFANDPAIQSFGNSSAFYRPHPHVETKGVTVGTNTDEVVKLEQETQASVELCTTSTMTEEVGFVDSSKYEEALRRAIAAEEMVLQYQMRICDGALNAERAKLDFEYQNVKKSSTLSDSDAQNLDFMYMQGLQRVESKKTRLEAIYHSNLSAVRDGRKLECLQPVMSVLENPRASRDPVVKNPLKKASPDITSEGSITNPGQYYGAIGTQRKTSPADTFVPVTGAVQSLKTNGATTPVDSTMTPSPSLSRSRNLSGGSSSSGASSVPSSGGTSTNTSNASSRLISDALEKGNKKNPPGIGLATSETNEVMEEAKKVKDTLPNEMRQILSSNNPYSSSPESSVTPLSASLPSNQDNLTTLESLGNFLETGKVLSSKKDHQVTNHRMDELDDWPSLDEIATSKPKKQTLPAYAAIAQTNGVKGKENSVPKSKPASVIQPEKPVNFAAIASLAADTKSGEPEDQWQQVGKKNKKKSEKKAPVVTAPPAMVQVIPGLSVPSHVASQTKSSNFERLITKMSETFPNLERKEIEHLIDEVRKRRNGLKGVPMLEILREAQNILRERDSKVGLGELLKGDESRLQASTGNMSDFVKDHLYKTKMCTYYQQGTCSRGEGCTYAHSKEQLRAPPKQTFCMNIANKGHCPYDQCIFAHSNAELVKVNPTTEIEEKATLSLETSSEEEVCSICMEGISPVSKLRLDCGHEYHEVCIKPWLRKEQSTCPTCRKHALLPEDFPKL